MAGLAALMTRNKRDRRRELEQIRERLADPVAMAELTGKEAEEAMKAKAAHETIKKMLNGKELLHQKSKSFDVLSQISYQDNDEEPGKSGFSNTYSAIYLGLILICIGIVITFVGLGEKGFKTLQLKLIGPIICIIGLTSIVLKVIQCSFPNLFQCTMPFRRKKLQDTDKSSMVENGTQKQSSILKDNKKSGGIMGHEDDDKKGEKTSSNTTPLQQDILSPRVTLQSSNKSARPRSTIPNYIGASSDDDDFDLPRRWNGADPKNSAVANERFPSNTPEGQKQNQTPPNNDTSSSNKIKTVRPRESGDQLKKDEIILNPDALFI